MANIQNELNNIKNAMYGKDVRNSIHDGIEAINKEVESTTGRQIDLDSTFNQLIINAGNSNAEIVDARVKNDGTSYSKLGDRLDAVDSQLAHIEKQVNGIINVKDFGAVGNGVTDDTEAIQDALNCETNGFRHIYVPDGTYLINQVTKLKLKSNTKLEFSKDAKFICKEINHDIYSILDVVNVENIEIINPTLIGDRDYNSKTTEGAGHGISCRGVKNLKIVGAKCSNCFTDGIYLNGIENGLVEFFTCDNNRRQGISITSCNNLMLRNGICSNTNGVAPEMGIDIEPNFSSDKLIGLVLDNIQTINNASAGIGVNITNLNTEDNIVDIAILNCKDNNSESGMMISNFEGDLSDKGVIYIDNFKANFSKGCGINICGYKADKSPKIVLNKPYIFSPNTSKGTNERYSDVAISIHGDVTTWDNGNKQGNIDIINPTIICNEIPLKRGIFIGYNGCISNVRIIDPLKIDIGDLTTLSNNSTKNLISVLYNDQTENIYITDRFKVLEVNTNYPLIRNYSTSIYTLINIQHTYSVQLREFLCWKYINKCLVNTIADSTEIVMPDDITFYCDSNKVSGKLKCSGEGAVNFKKINETTFSIEKIFGNWSFAE